jgi:hypothetical protein
MSGLANWFQWRISGRTDDSLPNLFPLSVTQLDFIKADTLAIYAKILTDVIERTQGLSEEEQGVLWDNCLASEMSHGLITRLSKAMADKAELFLVYNPGGTGILRLATEDEKTQIRADYEKQASSTVGVFISFKNYSRTDFVKLYSALEYCTVGALNKQMNLAQAIQLKFTDLRASVSAIDSGDVKEQAVKLANALANGSSVMLDAKDMLELAKPDLTSTQASMDFINEKRSFYLGMPASYVTGHQSKGIADTGEGDAKAIERGLKNYFVSIIKPTCKALFGKTVTFKSEDFRQLSSALEAMKTFEITSDELMSQDNKRTLINKLFGLDPDTKGDPPEPVKAPVLPDPGKAGPQAVPAKG